MIHDFLVRELHGQPRLILSNAQYRELLVANGFAPKSDQPNDHAGGNRGVVCRCAKNRDDFPIFTRIRRNQYQVNGRLVHLDGTSPN
jgi:hypothetical protein